MKVQSRVAVKPASTAFQTTGLGIAKFIAFAAYGRFHFVLIYYLSVEILTGIFFSSGQLCSTVNKSTFHHLRRTPLSSLGDEYNFLLKSLNIFQIGFIEIVLQR